MKPKLTTSGVLLACFLSFFMLASLADDIGPVKRLKRDGRRCAGSIDDHPCTREQQNRQDDYLAALTAKQLDSYLKKADQGDADAMYLLSQIPRENAEGVRDYPYRDPWLERAALAGHPIARYLVARSLNKEGKMDNAAYLKIAETAALAQGNGDIAWRLSNAYASTEPEENTDLPCRTGWVRNHFQFLPHDPAKALHWGRIAAEKGNIMAAELLCISSINNNFRYGLDKQSGEPVRWCTLAAQAMCSYSGAYWFSTLYRDGIGVQKSALDETYWKQISRERKSRTYRVPVTEWEYVGGLEQ